MKKLTAVQKILKEALKVLSPKHGTRNPAQTSRSVKTARKR